MEKETPIPYTKKRIMDMSFTAFNQKGFQSVSMDSVAKELKISKKTIYKHFGSKEELLEASLRYLFAQIEEKLALLQKQRAHKQLIVNYFEILRFWKLALGASLREELGRELPYLQERVDTFERQILVRYLIGLLKDLRTDDAIDYPSPSREFAMTCFHVMCSLTTANEEHAHYFLTSLMRGMAVKKKKKK